MARKSEANRLKSLQELLQQRESGSWFSAGGVVNEPASWSMLLERTTVVWLRARPEEHWSRVVAQGDRRPMRDNPTAMDELRGLLSGRERIYSQAHWTIDTSGRRPEEVAGEIARRAGGS